MRRLVYAALFAALTTPAMAETRQTGNLIFDIPNGWDAPVERDGRTTLWSDLPNDRCEYCRLLIGPEAAKSGSLADWLTRERLAVVDEDERDDWQVSRPAKLSGGNDRFPTAILGQTDGDDLQLLIAIEAGTRYYLIGLQGSAGEDDLKETLGVAGEVLMPWMAGMKFVSAGAKPLLGPPAPGDMTGMWWGWRMDSTVGIDGMMKMENSYRHVIFWPDGTFHDGTPPGGTASPDRAALVKGPLTDWGNYTTKGNTVTLGYADGRSETMTRKGSGWELDDYELAEAAPLKDGAKLNGKISSTHFTGMVPGTGTGGVGGGSETAFKPDGSYTGSSFGGGFGSFEAGGGYAVSSDRQTGGRYEVKDGLLIFRPTGGPPRAVLAFTTPQDEIMLGDQFLEGSVR